MPTLKQFSNLATNSGCQVAFCWARVVFRFRPFVAVKTFSPLCGGAPMIPDDFTLVPFVAVMSGKNLWWCGSMEKNWIFFFIHFFSFSQLYRKKQVKNVTHISCVSLTVFRKIKAMFLKLWQSIIAMCMCLQLSGHVWWRVNAKSVRGAAKRNGQTCGVRLKKTRGCNCCQRNINKVLGKIAEFTAYWAPRQRWLWLDLRKLWDIDSSFFLIPLK